MKLEKVVEILTLELTGPACLSNPDLKDATRIGVEAVKRWEAHRRECPARFRYLLPGETPAGDSP